jgi:hypothetical protein
METLACDGSVTTGRKVHALLWTPPAMPNAACDFNPAVLGANARSLDSGLAASCFDLGARETTETNEQEERRTIKGQRGKMLGRTVR